MKSLTAPAPHSNARAYFAILISFFLVALPVTPVMAASAASAAPVGSAKPRPEPIRSDFKSADSDAGGEAVPAEALGAPPVPAALAPVVTASKADSFPAGGDVDNDGKADQGDTIEYTVTINASGENATGVSFSDTIDGSTTLVPGSVTVTPVAINDSYIATGNVRIQVPAASGVLLSGDDDYLGAPAATLSGFGNALGNANGTAPGGTVTTTNGGTVILASDGSFSYNPGPGFEGADNFFYTLTNSAGSNVGQVTITVSDMIWFVNDDDPTPGGDGRLTNPFNCLVGAGCFDQVAADGAGDNIFLYSGSYTGGLTLLNNETLIGQGAGDTLANIAGITLAPHSDALPNTGGARPTVSAGSGNITLGTGNLLRGFNIGNSGAGAAISGTNFLALAVSEMTINGTGQALNLTNGTLNVSLDSITSTGGSKGVSLTTITGGSLTSGSTNVQTPSGVGVEVIGSVANVSFANTTVNGSGGTGVRLDNNTGNVSFADLDITPNSGQRALYATNNAISSGSITATSGTISTTNAVAVEITRASPTTSLSMALTSVSASGGTSGIVLQNTSGSFAVLGTTAGICGGSVTNTTNPAVAATVTAANTADCTGGTIQNMTADGIRLNNARNVSLTRMQIVNGAQSGIFGTAVNGFELISSFISNNGNAADEVGLKFTDVVNPGTVNGLVGTALNGANPTRIINSTVRQSGEFNVEVVNRTGTLTDLFVDGCQFTDTKLNAGPADADGFNVEMQNTAVATVRLQNSVFTNNFTQGAQLSAIDSANLTATVTSSTFTNNNEGFVCNHSGNSDLVCTVGGDTAAQGNHFEGEPGGAGTDTGALIVASTGSTGTVSASLTARIKHNHVTAANNQVNHSIIAFMSGVGTPGSVNISNNTVNHQVFGHAILVDTPDNAASPNFGVTANNNAVTNNAPGGHGVLVQARQNSTACVLIQNNTGTVAAGSSVARIRQNSVAGQNSTLNLKQGVSASNVATQVMIDNNPGVITSVNGAINVVANGACTTPTLAPSTIEITKTESVPSEIGKRGAHATEDATPTSSMGGVTSRPFVSMPSKQAAAPAASAPASPATLAAPAPVALGGGGDEEAETPASGPNSVGDPLGSGGTVSVNIGTLAPGDSVTITFQVVIDNPFTGNPAQVSNQGTVSGSNFANVLTDDPSVGGSADPTVTLIAVPPDVFIRDGRIAEPATGSANMIFTVVLSAPATGALTVNFTTADEPAGPGKAVAGADYTTTSGSVVFAAGENLKTISVPVLSDASAEPDETFLVNLTGATGSFTAILDNQAVGTITVNAPGTFLISEVRTSGPGGAGDDYVEVYNNSDTPLTVQTTDGSAGYAVVATNNGCSGDPVILGIIPNTTVIPARGHFLFVGPTYSLTAVAAGNLTLTAGINDDANVGLFSTSTLINLSSVAKLDGVGFGLNTADLCDLIREGATLPTAQGSTQQYAFVREFTLVAVNVPTPTDANDNATDFTVVSTTASTPVSAAITAPTLGAPGPQNMASPKLKKYSQVGVQYLDPTVAPNLAPNRVRKGCATPGVEECLPNRSAQGTMHLRRTFTNNTGGPISQLRFRVYDITGFPVTVAGDADMRLINAPQVTGVTGPSIGTVTVEATTLDGPTQTTFGGGLNSSVTAGIITLGNQLGNGASIHINFMLGVQQTGNYRVFVIVEALP
ncbi:MAG TPA: Calx-beta domain-containing protein [Pyrinomonadaceae bacterium]